MGVGAFSRSRSGCEKERDNLSTVQFVKWLLALEETQSVHNKIYQLVTRYPTHEPIKCHWNCKVMPIDAISNQNHDPSNSVLLFNSQERSTYQRKYAAEIVKKCKTNARESDEKTIRDRKFMHHDKNVLRTIFFDGRYCLIGKYPVEDGTINSQQ